MWSLISKTSVFYNIWKNPLQRERKESIFNWPQRSVRHGNKKKKKTCWQRKREDDILIEHCSKGQWGSSLKTEQEIDTLQETTNVNKFMQERQRKAVTIEELIKWRVWSWLRINAGGVPNTCKSIDRSPACWTEIEANGWVIRKQPTHEDRDNPWKRGLRPDRYTDRMISVLKERDTGGWAYGALAGWWGNGPPWRWCIAGLRGWTATLGLRHGPDSYGRQQ